MPNYGHEMAFVGAISVNHHLEVEGPFYDDNAADDNDSDNSDGFDYHDEIYGEMMEEVEREGSSEKEYPSQEPEPVGEAEVPWYDKPGIKLLIKARESQRHRECNHNDTTMYRKQIAVAKHSRGTALKAPSQKFFVQHKNNGHAGHLIHVLRKGVGWSRATTRPKNIDELIKQARQTDLTSNFLLKLQKYSRSNSVSLSTLLLRDSKIPVSHLTAL